MISGDSKFAVFNGHRMRHVWLNPGHRQSSLPRICGCTRICFAISGSTRMRRDIPLRIPAVGLNQMRTRPPHQVHRSVEASDHWTPPLPSRLSAAGLIVKILRRLLVGSIALLISCVECKLRNCCGLGRPSLGGLAAHAASLFPMCDL